MATEEQDVPEVETPGTEAVESAERVETTEASEPTAEDRARSMGWVPAEEFRGDPKRWVSADEFVRRGENEMPILRERLRKFEADKRELELTVRDLHSHYRKSEERAYLKALNEVRAETRRAVESGDVEAFEQAEKRREEIERERPVAAPPVAQGPTPTPEQTEWVTRNQWFVANSPDYDPDMSAYVLTRYQIEENANPGIAPADVLRRIDASLRKTFPNKFGANPRRDNAPRVEGGGATVRGAKRGYADLPAEAKQACDRFIKAGIFKSRDEYVAEYDWN